MWEEMDTAVSSVDEDEKCTRCPTADAGRRQVAHPDGRVATVPFHQGLDISPALLRAIARDIGMEVREFVGRA
jgi:hypothetical protein